MNCAHLGLFNASGRNNVIMPVGQSKRIVQTLRLKAAEVIQILCQYGRPRMFQSPLRRKCAELFVLAEKP